MTEPSVKRGSRMAGDPGATCPGTPESVVTLPDCRCHESPEAWRRCPLPQHNHDLWTEHGDNCPQSCTRRQILPLDTFDPGVLLVGRWLADICGCQGGATKGYQRAGWLVVAVDTDEAALRRNPAEIRVKADALAFVARYGHLFGALHLSAPCQRWTANGANPARMKYPDLITPGRELLNATGRPWVMENVPKAPLRRDLILCGTMFDLIATDSDGTTLHLDRHRVFESNVPLRLPLGAKHVSPHRCGTRGIQWAGVYGGARKNKAEARLIRKGGYVPPSALVQSNLLGGVPWMTEKGRRECIPPVYAEWVGAQLMAHVRAQGVAA